jgi:carboxylesterase type B
LQLPQQNGSLNEQNGEIMDVMFWIHGGLFYSGSAQSYPPNFFMDKNVVLVSLNYRLGAYGKSHRNKIQFNPKYIRLLN